MQADERDRLCAALADHYAIERELGHGGMAIVYLARDVKHDRPVALKVLRPELAASLGTERFLREINLAARLTHPHILPLHHSGEAAGFLYYVMPYVEGESLRDRLTRERQLPLEDAVQIGREVADALSYAHAQGVVHRDIKPENILLESGHAVVSDFGIARAINAAAGDKLTETGLAVGTPLYMSPEQGVGSTELDGRSDIYSLGCMLYEMLAGQPPFVGPTAESIVRQHLIADPPAVTGVRPGTPPEVAQALERALAKTPADRYPTAAAFAAALAQPTAPALERTARAHRSHNLPAPPTRLIGRDAELIALVTLLQRDAVRLVTLTGPGGAGKSRLAVQAAGGVAPEFTGGVYFVALRGINDAALVLPAWPARRGRRSGPAPRLRAHPGSRPRARRDRRATGRPPPRARAGGRASPRRAAQRDARPAAGPPAAPYRRRARSARPPADPAGSDRLELRPALVPRADLVPPLGGVRRRLHAGSGGSGLRRAPRSRARCGRRGRVADEPEPAPREWGDRGRSALREARYDSRIRHRTARRVRGGE